MFKKMYNLTTNELTKLFAKRSTVIVLLLIFLSAIAIPVISNGFSSETNPGKVIYQGQVGSINAQIKKLDTTQSKGKVISTFLSSQVDQNNMLLKYDIDMHGWRYQESAKYLSILTQIDTINLLKEKIAPSVITNNIPTGTKSADVRAYLNLPSNQYDATLAKLNTEKTAIYNSIKNNDYIAHYSNLVKSGNTQLATLKKQLNVMNEKLKTEPNNIQLQSDITRMNNSIGILENTIKIYQYRVDNKIPFDVNDWKSATLIGLEGLVPTVQKEMATKVEFLSSDHGSMTYDKYVANFKQTQAKTNAAIQADWYSLKHNIPQTQYQNNSSRDSTSSLVSMYAVIATIFMIILTGGIVSGEFSKETIKLLLIRPVSRFKVLFSKLIAVYIVGYFVLLGSMILVAISNGAVSGFKDYLTPVIKVSSGVVHTQNYLGSLTLNILHFSLTLLVFGALAFMLSTVLKSTAVSVAGSILLFGGAPLISMMMLTKNIMWVAKTPLPYLNLPAVGVIEKLSVGSGVLNTTLGGIEIAIVAVILAVIAFVSFIKSDVTR